MIKEANIVQFIFIVATNCVFEIRQDTEQGQTFLLVYSDK